MNTSFSGGTFTDYVIRECRWWSISDCICIASIYGQCQGRDIGLFEHARWWLFHYPKLMFVCQLLNRKSNLVVGYCRVSDDGEVSIGLAVGYRARGIGRRLLEEVTGMIVKQGHKDHVWARIAIENHVSQECFKACGWRPTQGVQGPMPGRKEDIWKIQ